MLELLVASLDPRKVPTIIGEESEKVADLHLGIICWERQMLQEAERLADGRERTALAVIRSPLTVLNCSRSDFVSGRVAGVVARSLAGQGEHDGR